MKIFGEGVAYDTFDTTGTGVFAVTKIGKIDKEKIAQRILKADYIYPPLKQNFRSLVLVTGFVLEAVRKWLKIITKVKIQKGECKEEDLESLDIKDPVFSLFASNKSTTEEVDKLDDNEAPELAVKPPIKKGER